MMSALLYFLLLALSSALGVATVELVCHGVLAGIRAFLCWRAFQDVRPGHPLPLAVVNGRLYMDALHPGAPYALWVLRRKSVRFRDDAERFEAEGVPTGHPSGGLQ